MADGHPFRLPDMHDYSSLPYSSYTHAGPNMPYANLLPIQDVNQLPPASSSTISLLPSVAPVSHNDQAGPSQEPVTTHFFGCNACPSKFALLGELREHIRSHSHSVERPFKCTVCDRTYKNANGLKYHVTTSMNNGKHVAKVAERGRPAKPREPIMVNLDGAEAGSSAEDEGREVFSCPLEGCNKRYKQLSGLRYHLTCGYQHDPAPTLQELLAADSALAGRLNGRGGALERAQAKAYQKRAAKGSDPGGSTGNSSQQHSAVSTNSSMSLNHPDHSYQDNLPPIPLSVSQQGLSLPAAPHPYQHHMALPPHLAMMPQSYSHYVPRRQDEEDGEGFVKLPEYGPYHIPHHQSHLPPLPPPHGNPTDARLY